MDSTGCSKSMDGHQPRPTHQESATEKRAIVESAARFITLDASKQQLNKWLQLEIVVCQWRKIEHLLEIPGPWIYAASRSGLRKVL